MNTIKQNPERVYIHPEFKKVLKIEAAKEGKSILEFTRDIMNRQQLHNIIKHFRKEHKGDEGGFDFP
jgi:hypothetical protein